MSNRFEHDMLRALKHAKDIRDKLSGRHTESDHITQGTHVPIFDLSILDQYPTNTLGDSFDNLIDILERYS